MSITTNSIVSNALTQLGYTNVSGLSAYWNDNSNTLTFNFNSATNTQISVAEYIAPSQSDVSEIVQFVLSEIGYSYINNLQIGWYTETNELEFIFDSAYLSTAYGTLYLTNGYAYLDLDNYGNVSDYASQAYSSSYGWVSATEYDLTYSEKVIIKQAYVAIDALESMSSATTTNDIAMIALDALGYTQVSGLTTSWNSSTQTSTLQANSIINSDGYNLTNFQAVVQTDSSGNIYSYNSVVTSNGYNYYYNQYDLDASEVFVIEAVNYALNEIDRITSNHDFTNGSATIVFDDFGNITSFTTSITHSDVGTLTTGGDASVLTSAELGIIGNVYNQLTINNSPAAIADNASTSEDTLVTIDVLANDTDADGDTLSVTSATATNGTVTINANGTLTYQGNQDFNGTDVINYTVSDGELTDTATVTVTVNAVNDTPSLTSSMSSHTSILTVDADSAYTHNTSIHFNDVEDGNTGGSYSVSGNPAWLTIDTSTGTLSGTPANTDAGNSSITLTYTDTSGASASDTYTLTVNTVTTTNTAPTAIADNASTSEDTLVTIDVLANDTDADGDTLSVTAATSSDGVVTINADGTLSFTPATNFTGNAVISYFVTDGTDTSVTTATVTVNAAASTTQLIQIRDAGSITKSQISIDEYGTDYTSGDTSKLMKFELWLDATELSSFATANPITEIRGYQFDMNWNDTEVGALNFSIIAGTNIGFNAANPDNAAITFNSTTGDVAMASSTAIVDTDISNDGPPSFLGTEVLIGTFYMNPNADLEAMSLSIDNMLIVTDTDNINPANYTTVLEISSADATIQTDANNYLDNISLDYFKDGLDTGISTLVEGGDISFPATSLDFDAVKLSDPAAYTSGIAADDAVDILRDIVFLDIIDTGTTTWNAADVNNDGIIAADDAVAVLRHIVHLDEIDTFDLIDNTTGNRISSLDANAIDVGQWTIVANGDVNQSGGFGDGYVVQVDIV